MANQTWIHIGLATLFLVSLCLGQPQQCQVANFTLQPNLTMSYFLGEWYVVSVRNTWTDQTGMFPSSNMRQMYFISPPLNVLGIRTDLQQNAWGGCTQINQRAIPYPTSNLTKFRIVSNISPAPAMAMRMPARRTMLGQSLWIVRTDYTGFAVVYSCDVIAADGTCSRPVAYTLNRNRFGHTPAELKKVDAALESVCVSPYALLSVVQNGRCEMGQNMFQRTMNAASPTQSPMNRPLTMQQMMNPSTWMNMPGMMGGGGWW